MAKILKEKGFSDVLPGQRLHRQCVTEYEKLKNPWKWEHGRNYWDREFQDELVSDDHQKKQLNLTLKSTGVSPS